MMGNTNNSTFVALPVGEIVMMGITSNSTLVATSLGEIVSNTSLGGASGEFGLFSHEGLLWPFPFFSVEAFTAMMYHCHVQSDKMVLFGIKLFLMVTCFLANVGLMWMLLSTKRAMTPSEVLGLNVSIMDVLYCLCLPLDIYASLHEVSETFHSVCDALFALNVFGCPLLLTFMCLERYMAAARPVAYIRLGRWEYRVVLCACAWVLTLTVGLLGYFVSLFTMVLPLSVIISLLFLVMLLCLLGIVWVLCQSGPGEGSGTSTPLKRRALKNIVAVMVPSAVAYSPLVATVPYMAVLMTEQSDTITSTQCHMLQFLLVFPNVGLFIGPLFYLSRLRQVICGTPSPKTQA